MGAFTTLTSFPIFSRRPLTDLNLAASVVYYPLVALFLGGVLALLSLALQSILSPLPIAAILLFVFVLMTGGLHLDGVADLWDALGAGGTAEHRLAVMKESQVGAFGVIALVLVLLLKFSLFFEIVNKGRWPLFLLMALLSRWAMVLAAFLGKYPRLAGTGQAFIGKIRRSQLLLATGLSLIGAELIGGISALIAMCLVAGLTVCFVSFLKQKLGGLTGDGLGALNEKVEVFVMLAMLVMPTVGRGGLL